MRFRRYSISLCRINHLTQKIMVAVGLVWQSVKGSMLLWFSHLNFACLCHKLNLELFSLSGLLISWKDTFSLKVKVLAKVALLYLLLNLDIQDAHMSQKSYLLLKDP